MDEACDLLEEEADEIEAIYKKFVRYMLNNSS